MNFFQEVLILGQFQHVKFQTGKNDYDDNVDDFEPGDFEDDLGDYVERQEEYIDQGNIDPDK
jgi:hypothetical protein